MIVAPIGRVEMAAIDRAETVGIEAVIAIADEETAATARIAVADDPKTLALSARMKARIVLLKHRAILNVQSLREQHTRKKERRPASAVTNWQFPNGGRPRQPIEKTEAPGALDLG